MKYIITESRLEKVVFKFLDSKLEGTVIKKGKFSDFVFAFPGEDVGLLAINKYHKKGDNYLHIYLPFFEEIQTMFDMNEGDVLEAIGKYVEVKLVSEPYVPAVVPISLLDCPLEETNIQ